MWNTPTPAVAGGVKAVADEDAAAVAVAKAKAEAAAAAVGAVAGIKAAEAAEAGSRKKISSRLEG